MSRVQRLVARVLDELSDAREHPGEGQAEDDSDQDPQMEIDVGSVDRHA
jgi:hypothetical protein